MAKTLATILSFFVVFGQKYILFIIIISPIPLEKNNFGCHRESYNNHCECDIAWV